MNADDTPVTDPTHLDYLLESVKSELDEEKDKRRRARNKRKAAKRKLKGKR